MDKNWHEDHYVYYIRNYKKVTVIRNPWDKFISAWKYLDSTKDLDLKTVLKKLPSIEGDRRQRHDFRHITRQQSDLIFDENDKLIVDYIIRFESFAEDVNTLLKSIGMEVNQIPCLRVNKEKPPYHYRQLFYDDECLSLFAKHFERDIKLLNYKY